MQIHFAIAVALGSLSLLHGCATNPSLADQLRLPPGYTAREVPYAAYRLEWIDRDTVLFSGERPPIDVERDDREFAIFKWHTPSEKVSRVMTVEKYGFFCYDRGSLHVEFTRGEFRVVRRGSIHHQEETIRKLGEGPDFQRFNPFTCRYENDLAPSNPNRVIAALFRNDHGVMEMERPSAQGQRWSYFLIRPSGEEIRLDKPVGPWNGRPLFSHYRQAYVFQYGGGDLSEKADKHIWVITAEGSVLDYKLANGPWLGGATRAMPVRDGILIFSPNVFGENEGVYLMRGEKVERLARGYVNAFAVSPDGCNVALNIANSRPKVGTVLVNTCKQDIAN